MFKRKVNIFVLIITVLFVTIPSMSKAEPANCQLIYPRFSLSLESVCIGNIPSTLRTLNNDIGDDAYYELSNSAIGGIARLSAGVGLNLKDRFNLAYDLSWFDSGGSNGKTTMSVIGMYPDKGYRYRGLDSDFSTTVLLYKLEKTSNSEGCTGESLHSGIYFKGGARLNNSRLSSGVVQGNHFETQHSMKIYDTSYLIGIGFRVADAGGAIAIELQYSGTFDKNPQIQVYTLSMRVNAPVINL